MPLCEPNFSHPQVLVDRSKPRATMWRCWTCSRKISFGAWSAWRSRTRRSSSWTFQNFLKRIPHFLPKLKTRFCQPPIMATGKLRLWHCGGEPKLHYNGRASIILTLYWVYVNMGGMTRLIHLLTYTIILPNLNLHVLITFKLNLRN